jgi:hypothetical protein
MWYYIRGKLIFFLFIGSIGFYISKMLYLLFSKRKRWGKYNT